MSFNDFSGRPPGWDEVYNELLDELEQKGIKDVDGTMVEEIMKKMEDSGVAPRFLTCSRTDDDDSNTGNDEYDVKEWKREGKNNSNNKEKSTMVHRKIGSNNGATRNKTNKDKIINEGFKMLRNNGGTTDYDRNDEHGVAKRKREGNNNNNNKETSTIGFSNDSATKNVTNAFENNNEIHNNGIQIISGVISIIILVVLIQIIIQ